MTSPPVIYSTSFPSLLVVHSSTTLSVILLFFYSTLLLFTSPFLVLLSTTIHILFSSLPLLLFSYSPLFSTGEFLSLAAMDTFLRSVQPEVNDLFVLSLVLINLLAWMDLFITQVTSCFSIRKLGGTVF